MAKRNVLGRGLDALIPDNAKELQKDVSSVSEIPLDKIAANPFQPRSKFDDEALNELAASIKEFGIIQPITLRKIDDDHFQIIAGERRYRASKVAGLETIPAFIREAEDIGMMEMALVENIQREDLDAIEIALSYQRLIEECKLTQDALSERVGRKRATVTNYLRLLKLPAQIQKGIIDKVITMGHARALVSVSELKDQLTIFKKIIAEDLSVRKTEELAKIYSEPTPEVVKPETAGDDEPVVSEINQTDYESLKAHLSEVLKTKINLTLNKKGEGRIAIPFGSIKDLERIIGIFDSLNG